MILKRSINYRVEHQKKGYNRWWFSDADVFPGLTTELEARENQLKTLHGNDCVRIVRSEMLEEVL